MLRDLSHPNLLRVVDIFDCADKIYIVTELAADGDLTSRGLSALISACALASECFEFSDFQGGGCPCI